MESLELQDRRVTITGGFGFGNRGVRMFMFTLRKDVLENNDSDS